MIARVIKRNSIFTGNLAEEVAIMERVRSKDPEIPYEIGWFWNMRYSKRGITKRFWVSPMLNKPLDDEELEEEAIENISLEELKESAVMQAVEAQAEVKVEAQFEFDGDDYDYEDEMECSDGKEEEEYVGEIMAIIGSAKARAERKTVESYEKTLVLPMSAEDIENSSPPILSPSSSPTHAVVDKRLEKLREGTSIITIESSRPRSREGTRKYYQSRSRRKSGSAKKVKRGKKKLVKQQS